MKSRTVIGRTFSKVKNRISSFGSLVSTTIESPNPLLVPPPLIEPRSATTITLAPSVATCHTTPNSLDGTQSPHLAISLTPIAALAIKTESWTVFNAHPRYHATAYVKFDVSCVVQNASTAIPASPTSDPGHLHALTVDLSLSGPAATLSHYGNLTYSSLKPNDHWINLIHTGIKDTSLASRLSTSLHSLGRSASRSAGKRLGRYSNIDLINRWLNILESDDDTSTYVREPVVVHATVRYKHSLLPETTMLEDKVGCRVKMTREEMERAEMSGVDLTLKKRVGSNEDGCVGNEEDEDEERVREARVLGAPWL